MLIEFGFDYASISGWSLDEYASWVLELSALFKERAKQQRSKSK